MQVVENEGGFKRPLNGLLELTRENNMLEWKRFVRLDQTQSYLQALSRSEGIPIDELGITCQLFQRIMGKQKSHLLFHRISR